MYDASEGAGTRESTFNAIFNLRSPKHMREVFDAYQDIADGNSIEDLIASEFSGNLQTAYLTMGIYIFALQVTFGIANLCRHLHN